MFKRWDKTLDLTDIWNNGDISEAEIPALGKEIASRLRNMYDDEFIAQDDELCHYSLSDIINAFDSVLTQEETESGDYFFESNIDEFNCYMENLYDWADENKRLCIITR